MKKFGFLSLLVGLFASALANNQTDADTYDYIVVGSGPGGGPLAANLAKNGSSVLLLEAGSDQGADLDQRIPAFAVVAYNDPVQRWDFFVKYHTDPAINRRFEHLTWRTTDGKFYVGQDPPAGAEQLGVYYPRAGTLGGCSTHNGMAAALPSNRDWDMIAELTGDKTWLASNMRQYFERLEHNDYLPQGTPGHGFDGFLNMHIANAEQIADESKLTTAVLGRTAEFLGQDSSKLAQLVSSDLNNDDPNKDQQVGVWGFPTHQNPKGQRVSARDAVIAVLNATSSNGTNTYKLKLSTDSFVTRVLFDTSCKKPRAIGVEYLSGQSMYAADPRYNRSTTGQTLRAYARKEVILSGGAFNTPQILKLSGIGPKAELESFNITVIHDLPGVGANLQDNYEISAIADASHNFTAPGPVCAPGTANDTCFSLWQQGSGPYTFGQLDSVQYKTKNAVYGERDLFIWASTYALRGFWPSNTVKPVIGDPATDPPSVFSFNIAKIHSRSRLGSVLLKSADPRQTPEINFRFFEDEDADADLAAMEEGVEFARSVFKSFGNGTVDGVGPFREKAPCVGSVECDTKEFIREQAWSHHASSSCAIGHEEDLMAVLDSKFRVMGVEGLRVVDASVFPRSPGGYPVLPCFIVSEKAFDAIVLNE